MKMKDIKKHSNPNRSNDSASPASKPPAIKFVDESGLDDDAPNRNNDVVEESKEIQTQ